MPGKSLASPLLVIAQMEFAPPSGADRPSFEGKTLLLPGVGIGNIGQLAIDLLVCSATRARALGALWHDAVEPVVGYEDCAPGAPPPGAPPPALRRTLELFALGEACVALQLRAPTAPGRAAAFAAALAAWARAERFGAVVVVSGASADARGDELLRTEGHDGWCVVASARRSSVSPLGETRDGRCAFSFSVSF